MKTPKPNLPSFQPNRLTEAPGLKIRQQRILRTALGLDDKTPIHTSMLQGLVNHPNPAVSAIAKNALNQTGTSSNNGPLISKGFPQTL